ncbi:MAG: 50S ribosomal protein L11 methyltransferase [Pseudomonadota bacterium]
MTSYTAFTTCGDAAAAEALGEALEAHMGAPMGTLTGVGVFALEDGSDRWEVGAYFAEAPDTVGLELLAAAHGARPFLVSKLDDRDWVAQVRRELTPVRVGRFVVHGGHDRARIPVNLLNLEIEAAMAFGTGRHGSTEGCLAALERLARIGAVRRPAGRPFRVADIGCGTGVLAMAAARLAPVRAMASDIDAVAAQAAQANVRANPSRGAVSVLCAPGFRHPRLHAAGPYDLMFLNILAKPLKRLAPQAARASRPGAVAVLAGLLDAQAAEVAAVYRGWRFEPLFRLSRRGWTTLALRRRL